MAQKLKYTSNGKAGGRADFMGVPRGWELSSRAASPVQSEYLLDKLCRDGATVPYSEYGDKYGNRHPGRDGDQSSQLLVYYKDGDRFKMALEFSMQAKNEKGELQTRADGTPLFHRSYVTSEQMDAYCVRHPGNRESLAQRLNGFREPGCSVYGFGEMPNFRRLGPGNDHVPVGLKYDRAGAGKNTFSETVAKGESVIAGGYNAAYERLESGTRRHNLVYTLKKAPDLFAMDPIKPFGKVDAAGVESRTGFSTENGRYKDGYLLVAEVDLSSPTEQFPKYSDGSWAGASGLKSSYLTTVQVGAKTTHALAITPDLADSLMRNSHCQYDPEKQAYVGAVSTPVYYAPNSGALGRPARREAEVMTVDAVYGGKAQARNVSEVKRLIDGNQVVKCPKGYTLAPEIIEGEVPGAMERQKLREPSLSEHLARHEKNAAMLRRLYKDAQDGKVSAARSKVPADHRDYDMDTTFVF